MPRKIVIARFNHEINAFSPIETTLKDFAPMWDEDAYRDQKGAPRWARFWILHNLCRTPAL